MSKYSEQEVRNALREIRRRNYLVNKYLHGKITKEELHAAGVDLDMPLDNILLNETREKLMSEASGLRSKKN